MSINFSVRGATATETLPTPATGEVSQFQSTECSVRVTNSSGESAQLATLATANIDIGGDKKLPDEANTCSSVRVNDSNIFLEGSNVVDDTDIDSGANNSVGYTEP